ncbi:MAG: cytochrome P450 [Chloroflexota bacterium]
MPLNKVDTGDINTDILNPDVYVSGVPHSAFKQLRDQDQVSWIEEDDGTGFWALTRYDDVVAASRQHKVFSAAKGIRLEEMDPEELEARKTMMEMDPPEHTAYRRLVQPPFLPRFVKTYEADMHLLAREVIASVRKQTEFDFVEVIARQLPMRMLGKMLGVPDKDGPWLVKMGDALIGNTDPEFTEFPVDLVDTDDYRLLPFRSPVSVPLFDYAEKQAEQKQRCPADDLTSMLLEKKRDGDNLSTLEFKNFFTLLVAAGNDTTRYTMAAGLHALLENPAQLMLLRRKPELINLAVEEMLRWGTVTMSFRRTVIQDIEFGGQQMQAGDKVMLFFIGADYDERQFMNPYEFDIQRTPNDHVAFGLKSPHKCIGEHLARLEIKVLFKELLTHFSDIQANGPVERLRSNFISGIKHLPIRVTWA